jgi:hypothetical protein
MHVIASISLAIFTACWLVHFKLMRRLRESLLERHPATLASIENSSRFPTEGLWRFAQGDGHKLLNDPEVSSHVRNLKRLYIATVAAWFVFCIALFTGGL